MAVGTDGLPSPASPFVALHPLNGGPSIVNGQVPRQRGSCCGSRGCPAIAAGCLSWNHHFLSCRYLLSLCLPFQVDYQHLNSTHFLSGFFSFCMVCKVLACVCHSRTYIVMICMYSVHISFYIEKGNTNGGGILVGEHIDKVHSL